MVDAADSKSASERSGGSSPSKGTKVICHLFAAAILLECKWALGQGAGHELGQMISRLIKNGFVAALMVLATVQSARAETFGPSLLFDAHTGELISQDRAGEAWYPASLTKLMTAYVVFQKIREGKLRLDQQIAVSEFANAQEASKIGVPPGKTVSVDFALQALLVYSANDMAAVLAEAASGSIGAFSGDMNAQAKRMGLTASHFVNPNGLFDPRQVISARDIGVIAALIINEFPEHQRYFEQQHVALGNRKLSNRNSLIRQMPDADGMKTGFVCNSGFNLVASATRNGRRLIAVVLGTKSGWARSQLAQLMLESGFERKDGAAKIKVAEIRNIDKPDHVVTDMTETVCPRKQNVMLANNEKFHGWSVALGFFDSPVVADKLLRDKLTEAQGWELSGMGGVVNMPAKGRYAAMVWGLAEDEAAAYCELAGPNQSPCRVYSPDFLDGVAAAALKKQSQPNPDVAQGSDASKKTVLPAKRSVKSKIRPAKRVKRLLNAKRKPT